MHKELKRAIVTWLLDNENEFCRVTKCREAFRAYICDEDWNYLIGGKDVSDFISDIDKVLYGRSTL